MIGLWISRSPFWAKETAKEKMAIKAVVKRRFITKVKISLNLFLLLLKRHFTNGKIICGVKGFFSLIEEIDLAVIILEYSRMTTLKGVPSTFRTMSEE